VHASDLQVILPLVDRHTTARDAARLIAADNLAALVITDAAGMPVAIVSAVDVLGLLIPGYVLDDVSLAGVYDERGADEAWAQVRERSIGELLDDDGVRVHDLLKVDSDATLLELAAQLATAHAHVALVKGSAGREPRFVTLPAVLEAILTHTSSSDDDRSPNA
jgi:CBS domain-containing protein